jgi:hypothetical protein
MVDGPAGSVGYLGSDNETQGSLNENLSVLSDAANAEAVPIRSLRGQRLLSQASVLRPELHGGGIRGRHEGGKPAEQPATIGEDPSATVREMQSQGASRSPPGREPDEQQSAEFTDAMRLLSPSISRAIANGDSMSLNYLRALQQAIIQEGSMPNTSVSIEETWSSLGKETQDRIRMDFENRNLRIVRPHPLVDGAVSRVGRLRAYGNAIVAPLAAQFIGAVMECRP